MPASLRYWLRDQYASADKAKRQRTLDSVRRKMMSADIIDSQQKLLDYTVCINDGPNFYILYKDIFIQQIYGFESQRQDPLILDCGSNIGLSILYFKHHYPHAQIIGFEPDPAILPYLEENLRQNNLNDVTIVKAGLAAEQNTLTFYSDAKYGSTFGKLVPHASTEGLTKYQVPCVRLYDYLTQPVDFLKMNIEGAEWEVLNDCGERLDLIREMVVEYHHLPGLPRTLHKILELLSRHGFEYMVNDFDLETNPAVASPFRLSADTRYFLLIYAKQTR